MNTKELQAQREKVVSELETGNTRLTQASLKGDKEKARELVIDRLVLASMLEAFDAELKASRKRELSDELKRLNDEHAKAFNTAQNARRNSDDLNTAYNARWTQGLVEVVAVTPDEMRSKADELAMATQAYKDARQAGNVLDELKLRIASLRSELEAV